MRNLNMQVKPRDIDPDILARSLDRQIKKRLINHNRQDAQIEKNLQEDELLSNKFQNTIVDDAVLESIYVYDDEYTSNNIKTLKVLDEFKSIYLDGDEISSLMELLDDNSQLRDHINKWSQSSQDSNVTDSQLIENFDAIAKKLLSTKGKAHLPIYLMLLKLIDFLKQSGQRPELQQELTKAARELEVQERGLISEFTGLYKKIITSKKNTYSQLSTMVKLAELKLQTNSIRGIIRELKIKLDISSSIQVLSLYLKINAKILLKPQNSPEYNCELNELLILEKSIISILSMNDMINHQFK